MSKFPWNLHNGDEVWWDDPDDGKCSRYHTIQDITYAGKIGDDDCVISIRDIDGSVLECFARELSVMRVWGKIR